jgi:hypothetical protein
VDKRFDDYVSDRQGQQIKISESVWIQCKSSDNPTSLLGEEVDLLIIDEAANMPEKIWFDFLMPVTASKSRKGRTIFISTPRGKNWFYKICMQLKEKNAYFHYSSIDGVEIDQEEWDRLKSISPKDYFAQNYEATFLDNAYSVFRDIDKCIIPNCLEEPKFNKRYIMGLDLAQVNDFTVATVIDRISHNVVAIDRFNKISYPLQIERIDNLQKKYNHSQIIIDLGNIGLPIADELRSRGCDVKSFKITGTISRELDKVGSKEKLINKLALDIENRNIHYPPDATLLSELESFGLEISDSGNTKYSAPEGMHDDCVISLALANWGITGIVKQENILAKKSMPIRKKVFQYR